MESSRESNNPVNLPRITIQFCTQCKWMLRAAYFAQELLSTFSTSLGEVALVPSTGGVFTVEIIHVQSKGEQEASPKEVQPGTQTSRLWDRKTEGGFPEVKHLKQLVRNIVDPTRDLGHVDRHKNITPSETRANENVAIESKPVPQLNPVERTIPTDPDAGVARGPSINRIERQSEGTKDAESKQSASQNIAEKTIPIDPDASIARGTPAEREGTTKIGKEDDGRCEDCT